MICRYGVWTPQGATLCYQCHGRVIRGRTIPDDQWAKLMSRADRPDWQVFRCDSVECREMTTVPHRVDVSALAHLRDHLNGSLGERRVSRLGRRAEMLQDGGVCAALVYGKYVAHYCDEDEGTFSLSEWEGDPRDPDGVFKQDLFQGLDGRVPLDTLLAFLRKVKT